MHIPPLAGLCTYDEAAQLGYTVDQSVDFLVRHAWVAKRSMDMGLYWLNGIPEWEVKEALSYHLYLNAEHVDLIRARVSEMRNPPPNMDKAPSAALDAFLDEVLWAESTLERMVGLYGVLKPALLAAYQSHYSGLNPLVAHPTRRLLRMLIVEEEEALAWGNQALAALTEDPAAMAQAQRWTEHLMAYLGAAGGMLGEQESILMEELPPARAQGKYQPDYMPRRDERFTQQENFVFPPHEVARTNGVSAEEKTLALMCKRALEMDVPEMMAPMIADAQDQPWDYFVDMCRQLWDEARHAMMGTVYMESKGIDWKGEIPLHPGASIRMNLHLPPLEAHAVLYAIEQSLMPAKTGKRYEWATAGESGDPLAKLFQDYDWADEVLHAQIGRRWLVPMLDMTREDVVKLGYQRAVETEDVLPQYADADKQINWWPDFVQKVLGQESQMNRERVHTSDPVYQAGIE